MKVGDLITVHPAADALYLIVGRGDMSRDDIELGKLWLVFGEEIGVRTMYEKWIEVIHGL